MSQWWYLFTKKINGYTSQHTITNPNYNRNYNRNHNINYRNYFALPKQLCNPINTDAPVFLNKKEYTELPTNVLHNFIWVSIVNPLAGYYRNTIKYIGFTPR